MIVESLFALLLSGQDCACEQERGSRFGIYNGIEEAYVIAVGAAADKVQRVVERRLRRQGLEATMRDLSTRRMLVAVSSTCLSDDGACSVHLVAIRPGWVGPLGRSIGAPVIIFSTALIANTERAVPTAARLATDQLLADRLANSNVARG